MDQLKGQVTEIRIIREGWGWMDVLHGSARERARVVGHPLGVDVGDTVEVDGVWTDHPRFGRQFKGREIRVLEPSDAVGAIEWLRSRLPHVGRKLATEMVERWGIPGVWDALAFDTTPTEGEWRPSPLAELRSINQHRARLIHEAYRAHVAERDQMVELKRWGLTDRQCAKVGEKWGRRAIAEMRRDPYQLAEHVTGFGFKRSDAVAMRMGLPQNHPSRIRACLSWLLEQAAEAGHVYVPSGRLVAQARSVLGGVTESEVRREGNALLDAGAIRRRGAAVYSAGLERAEASVAESVGRLIGGTKAAGEGEAA